MLPLAVKHHFNHLRISSDEHTLVVEWREDDEFFQSIKEPICRIRLTADDLVAMAAALRDGTKGRFGQRKWWKGQVLKVTGLPPAGLSWRKVSVTKWMFPFYSEWRPLTMPGPLVSAISEAAAYVQATSGPWSSDAQRHTQ